LDERGNYKDEEWAKIWATSRFPGLDYRSPYRPYPTTSFVWLLSFAGLLLFVPSLVALGLAVRATAKGNPWGWFAMAGATASLVGFFWLSDRLSPGGW
jgi:hypothetical protein